MSDGAGERILESRGSPSPYLGTRTCRALLGAIAEYLTRHETAASEDLTRCSARFGARSFSDKPSDLQRTRLAHGEQGTKYAREIDLRSGLFLQRIIHTAHATQLRPPGSGVVVISPASSSLLPSDGMAFHSTFVETPVNLAAGPCTSGSIPREDTHWAAVYDTT